VTDSKIAVFRSNTRGIAPGGQCVLVRILLVCAAAVLLCLPSTALGQTGQGIISGIVTDPTKASIPKASVVIRNKDTNVKISATTNGTGYYEVRDLNPGNYEVSVTASGFEKTTASGVVLEADGHPSIDLTLKVGNSDVTVYVTGDNPLIDTQTVSIGQVLTAEEMSALPNGQAPIWLAMLSPGVQSNYAQNYQLGGADPSWNGAGPQFGAFGRIGANEFSLDGAPNMANNRGQAINLSAEELGQTSVNITQFDSSVGHTFGISLTQTTKSGTNDLHGGIRYRRYDLRYFGMQHFQRGNYIYHTGLDGCSANPSSAACQLDQNEFGYPGGHLNYGDAGIGGPVFIPKLFDGRNRLFFFVGVTIETPINATSNTIAVPSAQERAGNFADLGCTSTATVPAYGQGPSGSYNCGVPISTVTGGTGTEAAALFTAAGCPSSPYYGQYQLWDPYSVTMVNGHPSRLPFCNNTIPANRLSTLPVVQMINSYLPNPNTYGSGGPGGQDYVFEAGGYNTYRSVTNRYDYAASNADHLFFRWTRAHYTLRNSTFMANNFGSYHQDRWITTGALGWSHILSPKTFMDVTVGATQYTALGFDYPGLQGYQPSQLGFPTYVDQYAAGFAQFPLMSISGVQQIGGTFYAESRFRTLAFRGNLTSVRGSHTLRAGAEWRQQNVSGGGPGASNNAAGPSGQYSFDDTFDEQNDGTQLDCPGCTSAQFNFPATSTGLGYAAFLMGVQSTATAQLAPPTSRSNPYYAFFAGDTWRVSRKLTLVPGVRYEFEYGPTEKHNRQIVGWDPNAPLTIAAEVNTAYQSVLASLPSKLSAAQIALANMPSSLSIKGGPIYAGVNGASIRQWISNWRFLPRLGAAYSVNPTTVIRAGGGLYYDTLDVLNESGTLDSDGFTANTGPVQSSTVYGTDFVPGVSPLSNPFPSSNGSRFAPAVGSSLGADYYAGSAATIGIYDHNRLPARSARAQASIEHQFGRTTMVQVAYVGSRTTDITLDGNANNTHSYASGYITASTVPSSYFTGGTEPNSAASSVLGTTVANPFNIGNLSSLELSDPVYYNILSKSSYINSPTITIANLVKAYPQMAALRFYNSIGTSQFQEVQANVSKRMGSGLVLNVAYQKNLQRDRDYFENVFDTHPSLESTIVSPPWRLTSTWVYTLPFGRSQRFARDGWMSTAFGGFRFSGSFEANPGALITFTGNGSTGGTSDVFYIGDPSKIRIKGIQYNTSGTPATINGFNLQSVGVSVNTATPSGGVSYTTCTYSGTGWVSYYSPVAGNTSADAASPCYPNAYNLRAFPQHIENVRAQSLANWNMNVGRTLNPNERFKVELRADLYNAFNHQRVAAVGGAQMNPTNAQFGQVTSDAGNGREIIFQVLVTY
jgi:Carboxypeptidase regulatory-like domain